MKTKHTNENVIQSNSSCACENFQTANNKRKHINSGSTCRFKTAL